MHLLSRKRTLILIGMALLLFMSVVYQIKSPLSKAADITAPSVTVKEGATGKEILDELFEKGYISNRLSYYSLALLDSLYNPIRTGAYYLARGMTTWEIYRQLANPALNYIHITEGLRKEQIADLLAERFGWNNQEKQIFLSSEMRNGTRNVEGYYFPDTYLLPEKVRPDEISQKMAAAFEEQVVKKYDDEVGRVVNMDVALKIASIIQREAAGKHDMPIISGIIWNRLFLDMPLQLDATLQYAKGDEKNGWWPRVLSEDKYIDSPYNTYKYDGLPPSPISNPGKDAIDAAFHPANTSCIYYLHDARGGFHCSRTYDEHLRNIQAHY